MFQERNIRGHSMYSAVLNIAGGFVKDIEDDIDILMNDQTITATERTNLTKARIRKRWCYP